MSLLLSYFIGSPKQIDMLANIFANAGHVALGALVLSQIVNGFDSTKMLVLVSGTGTVIFCWLTALALAHEGKEFYET